MKPMDAYNWLLNYYRETEYITSLGELAAWDQRTTMPSKGHVHRAEQLAILAKILHERATNPRIRARLGEVESSDIVKEPTSYGAVNIKYWRRMYDQATRIPEKLAVELARVTAQAETCWEQARPKNDWKTFEPHLKRVVELLRNKAEALGYENEAYDALLDNYEIGETAATIEPVLARLREGLVELNNKIAQSSVKPDLAPIKRQCSKEGQERLSRAVAQALGYDFDAGRIDSSVHPFTIGIGPNDIRITTRFVEDFFPAALFGTIHETGHALYEQGLPEEHWGTPAGHAVSLGIHESQSRMWENMVGRGSAFWSYVFPVAKKELEILDDVRFDDFLLMINAVKPSYIRVEADEITYNLHIMLRFELERALLKGDLSVQDLPGAWNEKMNDYMGIEPDNMACGVMQDVHWAAGLIGYFPTYTLGNIYAAQFYAAADSELGNLEEQLATGKFSVLLGWLRENIHNMGSILPPRELVASVTGNKPDPEYLIEYCNKKYGELYKL